MTTAADERFTRGAVSHVKQRAQLKAHYIVMSDRCSRGALGLRSLDTKRENLYFS